jgi:transposase InsO family protein
VTSVVSSVGRYRFISEHHAVYGVARLCRVLAVKRRQGYYDPPRLHRTRTPAAAGRGHHVPAHAEGWLYLATTIDLFNREVVGHAMAILIPH